MLYLYYNFFKEDDMPQVEVKALLFQEDGVWVAQCLDMDITCQAAKLSDLKKRIVNNIIAHVEISHKSGRDPNARKAPEKFWQAFRESEENEIPLKDFDPSTVVPILRISDLAECA